MYTSITNRGKSVKDKMIENYYILNQIVQSIDTGILIIFDGRLIHVNNETRRISLRTYKEIEQDLLACIAPSFRIEAMRSYFSVLYGEVDKLDLFIDILLPSGAPKTVRCRFSRIRIYESDGIFVTVHDINDNSVYQHINTPLTILCHRYLSDFASVFAKPYDFMVLLDEFYVITNIGLKFESLMGYKRASFIGKRFDSLPSLEPYVELTQALQNCKDASSGKVVRNLRISCKTADGRKAVFDLSLSMVNFRGVRQRMCALFRLVSIMQLSALAGAADGIGKAAKQYNFSGKTAIIAEDSEINFILMKKILEKTGMEILWAHNGQECVDIFNSHKDISLILMDMQMPVMDGFEAAEIILAADSTVPIIAQTAFGFDNDRKRIMEIGCADFVSKPIDRNLLLESIASVIR